VTLKISPVAEDKAYAEFAAKKAARQAERGPIRQERDGIVERMRADQAANPRPDTTSADAIAAVALGKPLPTKGPAASERPAELNKQLRLLDDAIEYLSDQMRAAQRRASLAAAEKVRPQYNGVKDKMVDAVLSAYSAVVAYDRFCEDFESAGYITDHLPKARPFFIEDRKYGRLAAWLHELAQEKIISRSLIPPKLDVTQ
jgi:hypothetical protein